MRPFKIACTITSQQKGGDIVIEVCIPRQPIEQSHSHASLRNKQPVTDTQLLLLGDVGDQIGRLRPNWLLLRALVESQQKCVLK